MLRKKRWRSREELILWTMCYTHILIWMTPGLPHRPRAYASVMWCLFRDRWQHPHHLLVGKQKWQGLIPVLSTGNKKLGKTKCFCHYDSTVAEALGLLSPYILCGSASGWTHPQPKSALLFCLYSHRNCSQTCLAPPGPRACFAH